MAEYKPSDFFIGIIDFFAVLLPGAIFCFIFRDFAQNRIFGPVLPHLNGDPQNWIAFVLSAYLFGHFLLSFGARLDPLYDKIFLPYMRRKGDELKLRAYTLVKRHPEAKYDLLKWATAFVRIHSATAAADIDRLDAESKFFRSMVIVLIVLMTSLHADWRLWVGWSGILLLTLWRYANQRWKRTELTYRYFIILSGLHGSQAGKAEKSEAASAVAE